MNRNLKMYILVNQDIKVSKGKLAGQVGHAVSAYFYHNFEQNKTLIDEYMNGLQKKIILKCAQSQLEQLEDAGFISIRDEGLTHLNPNTLTCVNLGVLADLSDHPDLEFVKDLKLL